MKYLIIPCLLFMSGCNLFKYKHEIDDAEQIATDVSKLSKDGGPQMQIVITQGKLLLEELKILENELSPDMGIIIADGTKLLADFNA